MQHKSRKFINDIAPLSPQPAAKKLATASLGFTIVELLIVIVVIGILAAIVIVAYTGIQNNATEAAVRSDLANISKKMEIYKTTNGTYPSSANGTELVAADFRISQSLYLANRNNIYYCLSDDSQRYAFGVYTSRGTQYYLVNGAVSLASALSGPETCNQISGTTYQIGFSPGPPAVWKAWTQ